MKILMFAGSFRSQSLNKKQLLAVKSFLLKNSHLEVEYVDVSSLEIPVYNQDLEELKGLPADIQNLCTKVKAADALIISTPEYNGSISGGLKNMVDWMSRDSSNVLKRKHLLLMAASPGRLGGIRGLWHSRVLFDALECFVYPEMFSLPSAHEAFDANGYYQDERTKMNVERLLTQFLEHLNS